MKEKSDPSGEGAIVSAALREWLDRELRELEPVWRSFRGKQRRMYYCWMAAAVVGMVALGFGVGYHWTYVLRVHLPIGAGIAGFIWLCVLLTSRAATMKGIRKRFEETLSALSFSDQEALARQEFGRVDFLNTLQDSFPARLLVGPDYWLYFRDVCQVCRVSDMKKLWARQEKNRLHYRVGGVRVRQRVDAGVSLMIEYREDTASARGWPEGLYLAGWDQLQAARELIARHCPRAKDLWEEK